MVFGYFVAISYPRTCVTLISVCCYSVFIVRVQLRSFCCYTVFHRTRANLRTSLYRVLRVQLFGFVACRINYFIRVQLSFDAISYHLRVLPYLGLVALRCCGIVLRCVLALCLRFAPASRPGGSWPLWVPLGSPDLFFALRASEVFLRAAQRCLG